MFASIGRTFVTGLFTLLPVLLTAYLLYWLAFTSESFLGNGLKWLLPDLNYFTGLGIIMGVLLVFCTGLLMKAWIVRRLFRFGETILLRIPVVKSVYPAFRDLFEFFSPNQSGLGEVVLVNFNQKKVIGFITQEDSKKLPPALQQQEEHVLVYIPMSYMIGGFTLLIPRTEITACDMGKEEAMKFALTAGIAGKN